MNKINLKNNETLSIIAYAIVCNNQIHDYQLRYLKTLIQYNHFEENYKFISDIFSKDSDAITWDQSVRYFNDEKKDTQMKLIEEILILIQLDGIFEEREKKFLDSFLNEMHKDDQLFKQTKIASDSIFTEFQNQDKHTRDHFHRFPKSITKVLDLIERIQNLFLDSSIMTENIKQTEKALSEEHSINFTQIINNGIEDYESIKPIYKDLDSEIKLLTESFASKSNDLEKLSKTEAGKEIAINYLEHKDIMLDNLNHFVKKTEQEIQNKENSLEFFTISLIGRTKAGKSTLHSILTGSEDNDIGQGKTQTTRFNRVYQWNNIRIIDTPGFEGANSETGKIDEEVARESIGISDVIVYVISDNQISENSFDLIKEIVNQNKYIIIFINHKLDIYHSKGNYIRFIRNPHGWLSHDDREVAGHEKRIKNRAEDEGFVKMLTLEKSHLLSAQLAMEDEFDEDRLHLIEASNIESFINTLTKIIREKGIFLRSQTILDGTRYIFSEAENALDKNTQQLFGILEMTKDNHQKTIKQLQQSDNKLKKNIKGLYSNQKSTLNNSVTDFVDQYYDSKDLDSDWKDYIESKNIDEIFEKQIKIYINAYENEVQNIIAESLDNIAFINKNIKGMDLENDLSIFDGIDFQRHTRRLGSLLSIAGGIGSFIVKALSITGPLAVVATVVLVVGVVINLASGLLKSKDQKIKEQKDKLSKELKNVLEESLEKSEKDLLEKVQKEVDKINNSINEIYQNTFLKFNEIYQLEMDLKHIYNDNKAILDELFAHRILDYLFDKKNKVIKVNRKVNELFEIFTDENQMIDIQKGELLREKVVIKGG